MKLAYLSGAYVPSRGANSMHVRGMCQAMANNGHDVTLFVRPGEIEAADDFAFYGVEPIFELSKQSRPQVRGLGALLNALGTRRAILSGDQPDLIYARETWALSLVADIGVPFIFESHCPPANQFHRVAESRILRSPSLCRIVFISESLRQIYFKEFPWLDPKLTIVAHDAADTRPLCDRSGIRKDKNNGRVRVGYVGSFQTGCGVDLISEIALLRPLDEFHIYGGSPREVATLSADNVDIRNMHFHGFVEPNKLPSIYARLDVVLAPYQADTRSINWASPMKLFEYMSYGRAILCSDFPVLREVLQHESTGIFVQHDCPRSWANAIEKLSNNDDMRRRLGAAGREALKRDFTWKSRAEKVLATHSSGLISKCAGNS